MVQQKANLTKTSKKVKWVCDICEVDKEYPKDKIFKVGNYHERICAECYDRGLFWSIKEAYKWRGQIIIDAKRGKK